MKSSPARATLFRSPGGGSSPGNPPPVVFSNGPETVVASFVAPASINLSYTKPGFVITLRAPLPIASLVPPAGRPPVVDRMQMSPGIVSVARNAILAVQPPPDPAGALFYDGQKKIFVDRLTGDSMDDDDVIIMPT